MINIITYCYYITAAKLLFQIVKKRLDQVEVGKGVEIPRKTGVQALIRAGRYDGSKEGRCKSLKYVISNKTHNINDGFKVIYRKVVNNDRSRFFHKERIYLTYQINPKRFREGKGSGNKSELNGKVEEFNKKYHTCGILISK